MPKGSSTNTFKLGFGDRKLCDLALAAVAASAGAQTDEEIIDWVNTTVEAVLVGGRAIIDFVRTIDTELAGIVADIVGTTGVILEAIGFAETGGNLVELLVGIVTRPEFRLRRREEG